MARRGAVLWSMVAAALVAAAVVVWVAVGGGSGDPSLHATPFPAKIPAPPTLGVDQNGRAVQLPRAGRPALVTFLFATCPDVCPLVSQEIAEALDRVGPSAAAAIDVVAISVDPTGDTPQRVRAFLTSHHLAGRMRYIIGTRAQLQPLWDGWGIIAQPSGKATKSEHTAKVILVDTRGRQVGAYPGALPFSTTDLADDIRTLEG